ncbi:MAG: DUF2273 domain-containing protein [Eubacteriales bacterium]|nr:DUF2273 domain-containing protein [Eubacteriales bacterium]MDD3073471.1 DUF2273 domain-containing protein [Eubacteriales bacterium]MDD4078754.1 DUF2273 domain-containing protein [Eubacteriales bacterium]MDD4768350.1 DUF2273 domain-containing protein [Eubacteriales bacterium]
MENSFFHIPRRWIGALIGLIGSLMLIFLGFWKAVFVVLCVGLGYFIGQRLDGEQSVSEFLGRLFPSR